MKSAALSFYASFYRRAWRTLAVCVVLALAQAALLGPVAFVLRRIFDVVIPAGDLRQLAWLGGGLVLLNVAAAALQLWLRKSALGLTKTITRAIREQLLQRVYTFSRAFYTQADRSRWHSIITSDSEKLDGLGDALTAHLLPAFVIMLGLSLALLALNWQLLLALAVCGPLLWLGHHFLKSAATRRANEHRRAFWQFSEGIWFALQRLDLTRLQSAEAFEQTRQHAHFATLSRTGSALQFFQTLYLALQNLLLTVALTVLLLLGGALVAAGKLTLGELISFNVVVALFGNHLRAALAAIPQLINGHQALLALYELLNAADEPPYRGNRRVDFQGKLALRGVSFQYGEKAVLRDINLTLEPGSTLVIAGPNGSGKTTLVNLLLGFYRPQTGAVLADDQPFEQLDLIELRSRIGVVPQNPELFPGTIWENLTYGSTDTERAHVEAAATLATAHDFITQLPAGYETRVGEHGVLLSGGQRQRLALARALLRQPRLLILDEPTNHLDKAAVAQLLTNLQRLTPAPTTLIISHDPQVLQQVWQTPSALFSLPEGRLTQPLPWATAHHP